MGKIWKWARFLLLRSTRFWSWNKYSVNLVWITACIIITRSVYFGNPVNDKSKKIWHNSNNLAIICCGNDFKQNLREIVNLCQVLTNLSAKQVLRLICKYNKSKYRQDILFIIKTYWMHKKIRVRNKDRIKRLSITTSTEYVEEDTIVWDDLLSLLDDKFEEKNVAQALIWEEVFWEEELLRLRCWDDWVWMMRRKMVGEPIDWVTHWLGNPLIREPIN